MEWDETHSADLDSNNHNSIQRQLGRAWRMESKGPGRSRKQQAIIPNPSTTNIENNDAQMTET